MYVRNYINHSLPAFSPDSPVADALETAREFGLTHLPVADDSDTFLGYIPAEALEGAEPEAFLGDFPAVQAEIQIGEDGHLLEVLKLMSDNQHVVAVTDSENRYGGVLIADELFNAYGEMLASKRPGAVLVIGMPAYDYSLSQISRLVEAEDVKILGSFLENDPEDSQNLLLTLKFDRTEISRAVSALDRFGFRIVGRFGEENTNFHAQDRIGLLIRLIEM